ncbi:MAG: MMPL family transporter [Flavobacteriales bacterium]|nr:MMPL family transporter [Flavobacteriales bacterium]MBT6013901.1 MMPL family transporter [Flavobacteriales bacterium]MBT7481979.1 MMPL family transporter [Flavobacteriales bacterium]
MANNARYADITYQMAKILPSDHKVYLDNQDFISEFGESQNTMVIAVQDDDFYTPNHLKEWSELTDSISILKGVNNVISITNLSILSTDSLKKKFLVEKWYNSDYTELELENAVKVFKEQKIYDGMLFNDESNASIMLIPIKKEVLEGPQRTDLIDKIVSLSSIYSNKTNVKIRFSGLPYLRTIESVKVKDEISLFILLTLLITSFILFLFFKSIRATLASILVVIIGVIFSFGTIGFLGYEISILMALVPPIIVVIGIPNCIFLINKYHTEFKISKDKNRSLHLMISKIGNITLLTNLTTASGFAAFILTKSETLQEFGIVASINICFIFLISLVVIPIWFSFMDAPKTRHTKHLDKKWVRAVVVLMSSWVKSKRQVIYTITIILTVLGIIGLLNVKTTGNVTDDLNRDSDLYKDLQFFESNFGGVMPFEIIVDTRDTNAINKLYFMNKIQRLQSELALYPEFSESISYINLVKYANQAYKNEGEKYYVLPQQMDLPRISSIIRKSEINDNLGFKLKDDINSKARVTLRMEDISTPRMDEIVSDLQPKVDEIFPSPQYNVTITGSSMVFLEGTKFLVVNLMYSLILVIILISIFMAWMFRSFRMVLVSLVPNLIPLLLTSAIMGYFGIPLKPSTILVFSIALGISVDDTIHFLAKYRQELLLNNWKIKESVYAALKETGVSMIYTSVVLFFGFFVFVASDFGGTVALGLLVSITLFFAMMSNLLLLPALLLSLEKSITTMAFRDPLMEVYDEEEDVELTRIKVKRKVK